MDRDVVERVLDQVVMGVCCSSSQDEIVPRRLLASSATSCLAHRLPTRGDA